MLVPHREDDPGYASPPPPRPPPAQLFPATSVWLCAIVLLLGGETRARVSCGLEKVERQINRCGCMQLDTGTTHTHAVQRFARTGPRPAASVLYQQRACVDACSRAAAGQHLVDESPVRHPPWPAIDPAAAAREIEGRARRVQSRKARVAHAKCCHAEDEGVEVDASVHKLARLGRRVLARGLVLHVPVQAQDALERAAESDQGLGQSRAALSGASWCQAPAQSGTATV